MEAFLILVPITLLFIFIILSGLFWSIRNNQYDDLKGAGERILFDPEQSKKLAKEEESD